MAVQLSTEILLAAQDVSCWAEQPTAVSWGRDSGPGQQPDASTCALTLIHHPENGPAPIPALGDRLEVRTVRTSGVVTDRISVFAGQVSDVAIEYTQGTGTSERTVSLVAVDTLALLSGMTIGDTPWPRQVITQRLTVIEDATVAQWPGSAAAAAISGLSSRAAAASPAWNNLYVVARDVDRKPVLDLLHELATAADAHVYVSPPSGGYSWGLVRFAPNRWLNPANAWHLDPCDVLADVRAWTNRTQIVNELRIGYGVPAGGAEQATVMASDLASQLDTLPRAAHQATSLDLAADAQALADLLIVAWATPGAGLDSVTYAVTSDDDADWTSIRDRRIGTLIDLPAPDGSSEHLWVIDGGTDEIHADGYVRTLALSDTPAYVKPLTWDQAPTDELWDTTPADLRWDDVRDEWPTMAEAGA